MTRSLLLVPFVLVSGCVSPTASTVLRWNPLPAAARSEGKVVLTEVVNKRPADRGGADLNFIGNSRNQYGSATAMRVDDAQATSQPEALDVSVRRLVGEGLSAAGFGVAPADDGGATALVAVEIKDFFGDGYMVYTARVALDLVVLDPKSRAERRRVSISADGNAGEFGVGRDTQTCSAWEGATSSPIYAKFCWLYAHTLGTLQKQMTAELSRPDVRAAILNVFSVPGAPAAGGGGAGGCTKDTDCKGDRICVKGECRSP
jgi:hypothetical protein